MLHFKIVLLAVLFGFWSDQAWAAFPDDPKPCKYGDAECIQKLVTYFLVEKSQGDSSISLPQIDPLKVTKINIKQGEESPVNIDLTFGNNEVQGYKYGKAVEVKGLGKDLTQKHEVTMQFKNVYFAGDYQISGKILILPVSGSGKNNITLVNLKLVLQFTGTPYEKDGATYMKIKHIKTDMIPERVHYYFGNLFNGDKALGDNMNLFLNENWKDIWDEIYVSVTKVFSKIFEGVINNVFSKYPYDKYFIE